MARRLAQDLCDTARAHPGTVGLAATQIGVMWAMIHVDLGDHPEAPSSPIPPVLINPRVIARDGSEVAREGCLSLPDITANVARAHRVTVTARDLDGREIAVEAEGFAARVLLHEIDHLHGVLILDRVSSLARDIFPRRAGRGGGGRGEARVARAATLARVAHIGRRWGEIDHIDHLAATVRMLEQAGVEDSHLRAAAWLHDVADAGVDPRDLAADLGPKVAQVVAAMNGPDDAWMTEPGAVVVWLAAQLARDPSRVGDLRDAARAANPSPCSPEVVERLLRAGGEAR